MLTVGSLFAGIGGFDLGFARQGFTIAWQIEQDRKAQAVLARHFPDVALYEDVRTVGATLTRVDVICGGFPCQDVSILGRRAGIDGERTGLFWQILRIARALDPRWMVLENVPGLLSSRGGRDFHAVLSALADCGFRWAYRILDSRYFGVAQRRRRVFIVLRARRCGDGAETVLFESASGRGDSEAGDEGWADVAATLTGRPYGAGVLTMSGRGAVRRFTPLECERLQGFPDGWTCLCGHGQRGSRFCACADTPRYQQLGNAVTVPVAEWIAQRIADVELSWPDDQPASAPMRIHTMRGA